MDIEYVINKYSKLIYKICLDILKNFSDAEDATQEVYINIYKNIDKYSEQDETKFKNIICKIAMNKCIDILRSKATKTKKLIVDNEVLLENYEIDNDILEEIHLKDRALYIKKIINDMNDPYKKVLNEYYINEMSIEEIAFKYNMKKETIKMQLFRGRKKLQEKLELDGGEVLL